MLVIKRSAVVCLKQLMTVSKGQEKRFYFSHDKANDTEKNSYSMDEYFFNRRAERESVSAERDTGEQGVSHSTHGSLWTGSRHRPHPASSLLFFFFFHPIRQLGNRSQAMRTTVECAVNAACP